MLIKQKGSMFKVFVTVDKHQGFKSLTVERHPSGLSIRPAMLKMHLFRISNARTSHLTITSEWGLLI